MKSGDDEIEKANPSSKQAQREAGQDILAIFCFYKSSECYE